MVMVKSRSNGTPRMQNAIAAGAAERRRVTADVWHLFTEGNPSEVVLPNCTQVNEAAMVEGLKAACTHRCAPGGMHACTPASSPVHTTLR
jgi:hypothetical protein